jgi:hypothetical protein
MQLGIGIGDMMTLAKKGLKDLEGEAGLNLPQKAQIIYDLIIDYSKKFEGVSESVAGSYIKQQARLVIASEEAKEALFDFLKPIAAAITGEKIKFWEDLYIAIGKNKQGLIDLGTTIGVFVGRIASAITTVSSFIASHTELTKTILSLVTAYKLVAYAAPLATVAIAASGTAAASAVPGWIALATNIKLAAAALATFMVYKTFRMTDVSAEWAGQAGLEGAPLPAGAGITKKGAITDPNAPAEMLRRYTSFELKKQMEDAAKKRQEELSSELQAGTEKAGKGGKGAAEDLLGEYFKMLDQKRQAEVQEAQDSITLLKATNEKKKAELEKSLAEGLIDGQTYYQRLQELQQSETDAALNLLELKRQAAAKGHEDALNDLARQGLSQEALNYRTQAEAAKYAMTLSQLNAETAKAKLEGEVKVTNELKRQVEVQRQYREKTEDLNLETAQLLGAISEQEAKLQKLTLDWQRTKDEAIRAGGYTPEYAAALDASLAAKQYNVRYGETFRGIGSEFSSGVANVIQGIRQGTLDINKTLVDMFNNIMMATLKPGFDAMGQALTSAIKWLLNSLSQALGGGSLFTGPGVQGKAPGIGGGESGGAGASAAEFWGWTVFEAHGGAFIRGVRQAFAGGGVVTRPTLFAMAGGAGLMGEAGPEGILPLTRVGSDLGVKALMPGPLTVNIINKTGVEATGRAQMQDDGSLDVILEKKVTGMAARGPLHNLIQAMIKGG